MKGIAAESKVAVKRDITSTIMATIGGVGIAYAITCIVFIAYALLLTYSNISEKYIPVVVIVTCIISVMVAGFDAAKSAESKGWLWGIIAGLIYVSILILIGLWVKKDIAFEAKAVTLLIISLAGGGLGGMFGINLKK